MAPSRRSGNNDNNNNENPDIAAIIAQQLQTILPQIVTQVTNNVNNANGGNGGGGNGNGGNNGCTFKAFQSCNPKEYDGKGGAIVLTRWIEKMENVIDNSGCAENQKVRYAASSLVNKALTWWNTQVQARGRVAAMAMSWNDFKALMVEEFCPSNEMEKLENEFWNHKIVGANHASYTNRFHELAKLVPHLVTPESSRIKRYIAGLAPEIRGMLRVTQPTTIQTAILRAGILTDEAISYGTLTKGSDKRKGVEESSKTGGSSKDNKKAKTGTRFMVIAPTRNEFIGSNPKCSKCNTHHPANGPCNVCFINFQKPGHGSFDVIVGMDWLSEHKAEIVCHEKVVRIPLESGEILYVQGEYFVKVFPEDLSRLSQQRQVKFRIDLVLGATPVAKSPYRLAPSEMQELSVHLQGVARQGFSYGPSHSLWGASVLLLRMKDGKDELFAKVSKREFGYKEVQISWSLGHPDWYIHVDPSKIKAVKNWKAPTTPSEIQSFFRCLPLDLRHYLYGTEELGLSIRSYEPSTHIRSKELNIASKRIVWIDTSGQGRGFKQRNILEKGYMVWFNIMEWKEMAVVLYFLDRIWVPYVQMGGENMKRTLLFMLANVYLVLRSRQSIKGLRVYCNNSRYLEWKGIIDRLTKSAHFLAIREDYSTERLARLYIDEIVARHGDTIGYEFALISQTDIGSERTIQTLEDMLRACVIDFGGNWDVHLLLVEFSYNNSYHSSIRCAPFEALCGDPNHLIGECPKPPKDKNQSAFVGGSWSDSGEEDDEKVKDETYLVAHASSEVCFESSYFSDENSSIDDLALDNEYDKLCKMSLKIITKNKRLKATRNSLENELRELKDKLSTLEKNKGVDLDCAKCHALKIENEKLKEESTRLNKFEKSTHCLNEMLSSQKPSGDRFRV
ncbi:putative reverse transcriptase domain-containing protein [Tanacetum coccineum]|uniref:Reverse transcriptase domain-containing protein n=1 Tax=Tanacetum coccineum TaxID=301880 RepID=A0ABQ4WC49_9ASTR